MRKTTIFNRQSSPKFLFYLFYIFIIFLIFGCGSGGDDNFSSDPSETGSASFNIAWYDTPLVGAAAETVITSAIDCEAAGISTIICEVYDESNTYLTSQDFACSAGQGTITGVPVGTNREIVILGEDADGNILYHGKKTGITVTAGQTNDAGTIDARPFYVSDLLAPEDGSVVTIDKFAFNWSFVETAYEYRIQISKDIDFETIVVDATTADTSYTPSGLLEESTAYYWKVYAFDIHANQSIASDVWSFTVGPCTYSISPTSRSVSSGGGGGSISVTSSTDDCSWTATEGVDWISITSGGSGSGDGTVTYSVLANTSSKSRSATITVAGQSHTVTQEGVPCTYSISPSSNSFPSGGGTGSINVTSSAGDCSWTATEGVAWISITSGGSGSGDGTVTYSVLANTSSKSRNATITVAGQSHTVTQEGVPCTYSISPSSNSIPAGGGGGSISVTSSAGDCSWTATEGVGWISITSGGSGSGNGTVTYSVSSNTSSNPRSATITVAGQSHTVTQEGVPCTYLISPTSNSFPASGGRGSITVTSSAGDCGWTATVTEGVDWISITSDSSGSGNGTVNYKVENSHSQFRTGTITVAGKIHTVYQVPK